MKKRSNGGYGLLWACLLTGLTMVCSSEVRADGNETTFPRRIVVEEGTGTWCKYCVSGIAALRELMANHPDDVIPIVCHFDDPMKTSSYSQLERTFFRDGIPGCVFNRDYSMLAVEPAYVEGAFQTQSLTANVGIEVEASFVDETEAGIQINTSTTFGYASSNVDLRVAFVLVEDSVHSTLNGYAQQNAYSKQSSDESAGEPMGGFEDLPPVIPAEQMYYEHVARLIFKSYSGTLNSIPTEVEQGATYTYQYTLDETAFQSAKVMDKGRLTIVAMILDVASGRIVNAAQTEVKRKASDAIRTIDVLPVRFGIEDGRIRVEGDYDRFQVFTADGVEVRNEALPRGYYLVRVVKGRVVRVEKVLNH